MFKILEHLPCYTQNFPLIFSKKLRACTACYIQYSTPTEETKMDSDIEEQSVEIPKRRFIGQSGSALQDTSSLSMVSSTGSLTGTIFTRHRPVYKLSVLCTVES